MSAMRGGARSHRVAAHRGGAGAECSRSAISRGAGLANSADAQEGVASFVAKRDACFTEH